jgi:heme/copper-type cytochrome/quinol oxidase subunit 2
MTIYSYIIIYVIVGVVLSAIFDTMHYLTRSVVDEETYEKNGFSNVERLGIILVWPRVVIGLILAYSGMVQVEIEQTDDEEETKE